MKDLILEYGALGLGALLSLAAAWLGRAALTRAWLRDFLARLRDTARTVTLEVEQVYVDAKTSGQLPGSEGGVELTKAEQQKALDLAVNRLADMVGLGALERALKIMGLPTIPEFVRSYLTSYVEAHVKLLSIEQAAANGTSAVKTAVVAAAVVRASGEFRPQMPLMPPMPPRPGG